MEDEEKSCQRDPIGYLVCADQLAHLRGGEPLELTDLPLINQGAQRSGIGRNKQGGVR